MTIATHSAHLLETYARTDVTFVRGNGAWLEDVDGRRYLDLLGGIAVVGLGHRHPAPLAAAHEQLDKLWHVSNLYWTEPMTRLAELLSERFGGADAFFCNSGAEAVESAIKYARKATGKPGIVALENSFHGRTLGALSVTGQPAKRATFEPLFPGVTFAKINDSASLAAAVDDETACILIEPVQGEGGIHPARPEFLARARDIADEHGALLVFDEVQTGVGRTGSFFAWQRLGTKPDAVTLAKGLANGLPIGALLVADELPVAFEPGDHASTFGGNPVACAAACAVVETVDEALLTKVVRQGDALARTLERLPGAVEVRGAGLLLGLEIDRVARDVIAACVEHGVLVGSAGERVLRLSPPLTISDDELAHGLAVLEEVLA
ncbi:MAG TPA: acetylornithine/succinylornithine family transaminase [Gaiellaceae bacterium]